MRAAVKVRAPAISDCESFVRLVKASKRLHRGWISPASTVAAFKAYLKRARRDDFEALLVRRLEDDAIVGAFNLSQIFYGGFRNAYLGYWVGAGFEGHGYMAQGLALTLRHAFRVLKLHRVEANIQPGNARSIVLVERAGFRLEGFSPRYLRIGGRWRDHERWAMTVEDFRAQA